MADYIEVI